MPEGQFVLDLLLGMLWLGVAAAIALVAIGTLTSAWGPTLVLLLVGVASAAFGAKWLRTAARQLSDPQPAFRIDADGITDNQQRGGPRYIAWDDVDHFEAGWVGGSEVVFACPGRGSAPDRRNWLATASDQTPFVVCYRLGMNHEAVRAMLEGHLALHRRLRAPA
jgi:hypothetical protein